MNGKREIECRGQATKPLSIAYKKCTHQKETQTHFNYFFAFRQMQETEESTNIQDQQTQQHKGMEQAEDVLQTTDSATVVDQARKPSLSEQEITGMPMSTQKTEKVK